MAEEKKVKKDHCKWFREMRSLPVVQINLGRNTRSI